MSCKFPIHVFNRSKKNNGKLKEPFFYVYFMLSLKTNSRLESFEALFHKRHINQL